MTNAVLSRTPATQPSRTPSKASETLDGAVHDGAPSVLRSSTDGERLRTDN